MGVPATLPELSEWILLAFCIIIPTIYSTGCYDKCLKNGEHQKLF